MCPTPCWYWGQRAGVQGARGGATLGELLRASLCLHPQDLFFHYVFNNFLHAQVEVCVSTMLSSGPPADSGSDTPSENPVVKHVSWAPGSRSPLVCGEEGGALLQVSPCLSCAARPFRGGVLVSSRGPESWKTACGVRGWGLVEW